MKKLIPVITALVLPAASAQAASGELDLMGGTRTELTRSLSDTAQLTAFGYDPTLSVNPNRGNFSTQVRIPLPPNLAGLSALTLKYDSQNPVNAGIGTGWTLDLPLIQRSRGASEATPFTVSGPIGAGLLTRTAEDTSALLGRLERLLQHSSAGLGVQPYRFHVDPENYSLFLKVENRSGTALGWVALQTNGTAWVFSPDGVPTRLADVHGNSATFQWSGGLLRSVQDPTQGWQARIDYLSEVRALPQATPQGFFRLPLGIQSLSVQHKSAKSRALYHFSYEGEYLSRVVQENAVLPLFQGGYAAMKSSSNATSNTLTASDKSQPIFDVSLSSARYASDQNDYLLTDLNGDGRTDRVYLGAEAMPEEIKESTKAKIKQFETGTRKTLDEITASLNANLLPIQDRYSRQMRVEMGVLEGGANGTTFKTDESLDLGRFGIRLAQMSLRHSYNSSTNEVTFKSTAAQNGLYFVDLYGSGRKSLIFCPGDQAADKDTVKVSGDQHSISNLHLSILSLVDPPQVAGKSFTNTLAFGGGTPRVLEQTINESELRRRWNEVTNHADLHASTNTLLNVSKWVERTEDFRCNQHSLFFDANRDGTMDVLTGKTLYLRQLGMHGSSSQAVELSDNELRQFFDAPEKFSFDHWKHVLAWNPSLSRFELRNGLYYANPSTGRMHLDQFGDGTATAHAPAQQLLTELHSPFGGKISLTYAFKDGIWVISKTLKDANNTTTTGSVPSVATGSLAKIPLAKSDFYYDSPLRDPMTGIFTGFHVTRELQTVPSSKNLVRPREVIRTYLRDQSTAVVHYQSRARLQGYPIEELVRNPDNREVFALKTTEWNISPLWSAEGQGDRLLVLPSRSEDKKFNAKLNLISSKKTLRKIVKWRTDPGAGALLPTQTLTQVEDGTNEDQGNFLETFEFLPAIYRSSLIEKRSSDQNGKSYRNPIQFTNSALGDRERACQGEICFSTIRDSLGRVIRQQSNIKAPGAHFSDLTYQDHSPILATLKDQDSQGRLFEVVADPLTGKFLEVTTPEGKATQYEYSSDGFLKSARTRNGPQASFTDRLVLTMSVPSAQARLQVDDRLETIDFDGFGQAFRKQIQTADGTLYSGETVQGGKDKPLLTSLASFSGFQDVADERFWASRQRWDTLGRIGSDWSRADGTWTYGYWSNCVGKNFNNSLRTDLCTNVFGHPSSMDHHGESTHYATNFVGDILANTDQKAWAHDSYGEPIRTESSGGRRMGDTAKWTSSVKNNPVRRTIEDESGWFRQMDAQGRLLETRRTHTPQATDLLEKREYTFGRLTHSVATDGNGKTIPALEQKIDYDASGKPVLIQVGTLSVHKQYDAYDRLSLEQVSTGGSTLSQTRYSHSHGHMTAIPGLVQSVKRNEEGKISSVTYANGLTLDRTYSQRSSRPEQISVSSERGKAFSESYTYDPHTLMMTSRTFGSTGTSRDTTESFKHTGPDGAGRGVFLSDAPSMARASAPQRDHRGRVQTLGVPNSPRSLTWNDDNLAEFNGHTFYYNAEGSLVASCPGTGAAAKPMGHPACTLRISADRMVIDGSVVSLVRIDGLPVAVQVGNQSYPVVADHLGSIRAMWTSDGSELLWSRRYSAWGKKTVEFSRTHRTEAQRLERLCVWGFATLIELPGVGSDIYWSASRVYAPAIQEWLSPDPMVKWNPRLAATKPGNWASTRYANNSPLAYVDPSGAWVVKLGMSASANAVQGVSISSGVAFSYTQAEGFRHGHYVSVGTGVVVGHAGLSLSAEGGVSGGSIHTGVSHAVNHGGAMPVGRFLLGLDLGITPEGDPSLKVSLAGGKTPEAHITVEREWIQQNEGSVWSTIAAPFKLLESIFKLEANDRFEAFSPEFRLEYDSPMLDHERFDSRGGTIA